MKSTRRSFFAVLTAGLLAVVLKPSRNLRAEAERISALARDWPFNFQLIMQRHLFGAGRYHYMEKEFGIPFNDRELFDALVVYEYERTIALDRVIPFRVIDPSSPGELQAFIGRVQDMVRRRALRPEWHPLPIAYKRLG